MRIESYRFALIIVLFTLIGIVGCSIPNNKKSSDLCQLKNKECIRKKVNIEMFTSKGKIILEINGEESPLTATTFIELIKLGFYDGSLFNRVIKDPLPFVIQGGDLASEDNYKIGGFSNKDKNYLRTKFLNSISNSALCNPNHFRHLVI